MVKNNRMTKIGLAKIEAAKRSGQWDKSNRPDILFDMPKEFQSALEGNKKDKDHFN